MKTLTAVLFAGGESRRMGVDKATLILEGEPLWSRQLRLLRELSPETILISARAKPGWCPHDIMVIPDEPPSRGPLSGLIATLRTIQTTHLFAMAVDLPRMTAWHLKHLWSLARPGVGVVPRNGNYFEPLCAVYPSQAIASIEAILPAGDVSLQNAVRILAAGRKALIYAVKNRERSAYDNMNTPEEWACR